MDPRENIARNAIAAAIADRWHDRHIPLSVRQRAAEAALEVAAEWVDRQDLGQQPLRFNLHPFSEPTEELLEAVRRAKTEQPTWRERCWPSA